MINRQKSCKYFLKSSTYNIENQFHFYFQHLIQLANLPSESGISVTPRIAFLNRMVLAVRNLSRASNIRLLSMVNPFYRVRIGYRSAHYRLTKRTLKGHQKDIYISI
jgi:hypothetical protein